GIRIVNRDVYNSYKEYFDTKKIKFAQTPYFSSRVSKLNFRGAQELRNKFRNVFGVLDILWKKSKSKQCS
ncbi:MAG: hypothetical protein AABX07_04455, partial [Nanoarchaeota archaeon]